MHVFLYNGRDGTGGRNFPETASPRLTRGRYSRYRQHLLPLLNLLHLPCSFVSAPPTTRTSLLHIASSSFFSSTILSCVCVCVCIEIFISRLFEEKIAYVFCREKGLIKKEMEIICVNVLEIVFFVSNLRRSLMFIGQYNFCCPHVEKLLISRLRNLMKMKNVYNFKFFKLRLLLLLIY